jgi:hypothetical protein
MKTETLEQLAKGNWGSKVRYLVLNRVIKFIAVCLVLILVFWLILVEDYTTLFFLLGGALGFSIFVTLRFLESRFGKGGLKEDYGDSPEVRKVTPREETKRKSAVGD